jgi:hypothetical protein
MRFSIDYIPATQIKEIASDWESLEEGPEMTLFQSYDWNDMLLKYYVPKDTCDYESIYAVIKRDNKICLIAPLWIIKRLFRFINKKGILVLGRDSYSDYLNLIYKDFDREAFEFLICNLKEKYNQKVFVFEHLNESTEIYKYITSSYQIIKDEDEPCVSLQIPSSLEDYHKLLSKHSKQNLRTANNRLIKDNMTIVLNMDNNLVDKNSCLEIRESKLSVQYQQIPRFKLYKYRLVNRYLYHFPRFTPITCYKGSKVMTASINDKLCAFFNYAYDEPHKRIVIISAGTDLTYARYSPGMLLMYNFIKQVIEEKMYVEIDFTRGNEPYKFALGGKQHNNHNIHFKI